MIAGGGTGGHLFPALALAETFKERDPANEILFVGGRTGLEARVLAKEGYPLKTIGVLGLKGQSFLKKIQGFMVLPKSIFEAWSIIHSFKPDLVLGVGGYASGPVVLTAWALRCKTAIQEQNFFPGFSNRILGRLVNRIFLSFEGSDRHFPKRKAMLTGNPVRKVITPQERREKESKFTLLILGGSQGAHHLNQVMQEAIPYLLRLKGGIRMIHQTGEKDYREVQDVYQRERLEAEVSPFIHDIERVYAAADLILCRAGATTLFELMAMGKPAILVPYPHAANDHQTLNAQALAEAGAAVMIPNGDLSGKELSRIVQQLREDPARLKRMEEKVAALAKPDAARRIVNLCYEMVGHG